MFQFKIIIPITEIDQIFKSNKIFFNILVI
jgi:hypothetical protein